MGIFPAMTTEKGTVFAFPDVCKTPTPGGPVPIPYPNIGQNSQGKGSKKVKIRNKQTLRKGDTSARMTSGDEAGSAMGVKSSTTKGKAVNKAGFPKVKVEKKDISHHLTPTEQNKGNIIGMQVAPSQSKVKVIGLPPFGPDDPDDGMSPAQREALARDFYNKHFRGDFKGRLRKKLKREPTKAEVDADIEKHVAAIDTSKPVVETSVPPPPKLEQWQREDGTHIGNYFASPGTDPKTLGIDTTGRKARTYPVTTPVPALKSTAGDYVWPDGKETKGGSTQFCIPSTFSGDFKPEGS